MKRASKAEFCTQARKSPNAEPNSSVAASSIRPLKSNYSRINNVLNSILLCIGICAVMSACSSGDYVANPSSPANGSVNPLNPLGADQFTWSDAGKAQIIATINGNPWKSDSAWYKRDNNTGTNHIFGKKNIPNDSTHHWQQIHFYFTNTWPTNVYNMGFKQYSTSAEYNPRYNDADSTATSGILTYKSANGNSGGMYLEEFNDTTVFRGKCYFQAVNSTGDIMNFTDCSFNVKVIP